MSAIQNAKELADLIKAGGDIELYRKIVELEGEIIDLTRAKRELEIRNEELQAKQILQKSLQFRSPFYFVDGEPDVPLCPRCWEKDRVAIHLIAFDTLRRCPQCNRDFLKENRQRNVRVLKG